MLAKICEGIPDAIAQLRDKGGRFLAEFKYDGVRAQVHLLPDGTVCAPLPPTSRLAACTHAFTLPFSPPLCFRVSLQRPLDCTTVCQGHAPGQNVIRCSLRNLPPNIGLKQLGHQFKESEHHQHEHHQHDRLLLVLTVPSDPFLVACRSRFSHATARTAAARSPTSHAPSVPLQKVNTLSEPQRRGPRIVTD